MLAGVALACAWSLARVAADSPPPDDADLLTSSATAEPAYDAFRRPRPVEILGYDGDAMEPALSGDGRYLLFNNLNDPDVDTNLHYAERLDDLTFVYRGEVDGANSTALDGVPALDDGGHLYFVSSRSYPATLSTLYRARFEEGGVSQVELLPDLSRGEMGWVDFDVGVSPDGDWLYFAEGWFGGGKVAAADLHAARRSEGSFARHGPSADWPRRVNTAALEYAAAISRDGRELFFTRYDPRRPSTPPAIYRAFRTRPDEPFGAPERLGRLTGFVEAPALSPDERSLYFHRSQSGRVAIWRAFRSSTPGAGTNAGRGEARPPRRHMRESSRARYETEEAE